ncbi:MAG: hypothetical protein WD844_07470 [Thermoleophilaceae bacterium]
MARAGSSLRRRVRLARSRAAAGRRERAYRRRRRREARAPRRRRGRGVAGGAIVRTLLLLALIVAVAAIPLLVVYRSECPGDDGPRTRWSFVAPFSDPPGDCRGHQSGVEVVLDEVGL